MALEFGHYKMQEKYDMADEIYSKFKDNLILAKKMQMPI